ncbi:hypothetical protein D9M69_475320 [compost metagenome]
MLLLAARDLIHRALAGAQHVHVGGVAGDGAIEHPHLLLDGRGALVGRLGMLPLLYRALAQPLLLLLQRQGLGPNVVHLARVGERQVGAAALVDLVGVAHQRLGILVELLRPRVLVGHDLEHLVSLAPAARDLLVQDLRALGGRVACVRKLLVVGAAHRGGDAAQDAGDLGHRPIANEQLGDGLDDLAIFVPAVDSARMPRTMLAMLALMSAAKPLACG